MLVQIAGYNIDKSLIDKLDPNIATPETISAAYARVSRSSKSVSELRKESIRQIEKARTSNESIIFGMGHSSVAEHAVFNIDLIGISRHLTEIVQASRLASFTEKSQRYVTFSRDYIIPAELDDPAHADLKDSYQSLMDALFSEYETTYQLLVRHYETHLPDLPRRELEGKAKEDARYILPLATRTQMGMTINARSLESLLRRLYQTDLSEARELYDKLFSPISGISPSLVKYTTGGDLPGKINIRELNSTGADELAPDTVRIVDGKIPAENDILATLLYEHSNGSFSHCRRMIDSLTKEQTARLWKDLFEGIEPWHKMPRAFEMIDLSFELKMSEACWGQFKRHRMSTMIKKKHGGDNDPVIPQGILTVGREENWRLLITQAKRFSDELQLRLPAIIPYTRLNACSVTVLTRMNLREIYHFVRLRSDKHAQWEIRELSDGLCSLLRELFPNATRFLAGKSDFPQNI